MANYHTLCFEVKQGVNAPEFVAGLFQVTWDEWYVSRYAERNGSWWTKETLERWGVGLYLSDTTIFDGKPYEPFVCDDDMTYRWTLSTSSKFSEEAMPLIRWAWGRLGPWCPSSDLGVVMRRWNCVELVQTVREHHQTTPSTVGQKRPLRAFYLLDGSLVVAGTETLTATLRRPGTGAGLRGTVLVPARGVG